MQSGLIRCCKLALVSAQLFLVAPLLCQVNENAPDSLSSLFEPELNLHAGKLIKIHGEYPENDISILSELNLSFRTRGKKNWQLDRGLPSLGCSVLVANFGNVPVLGYAVGIVPTIRHEWPKKKWSLGIRGGIGLSWFSNPYDAMDNPRNLVIGTRVTAMAAGWAGAMIPVSHHWRWNIGVSATHCSDGHLGVPNIGANVLAVTTGIAYSPLDLLNQNSPLTRRQLAVNIRSWNWEIAALLGLHEFQGTTRPVGGPLYPVYGVGLGGRYDRNRNGGVLMGINTYYYSAFRDYILSQELFPASEAHLRAYNVVVYSGYQWFYSRFSLFIQVGINAYAPFYHRFAEVWDLPAKGFLNEWTSQKLGYRYYFFGQKLGVGIAIKTNGGTADFFESSLVWSLRPKKNN